MNHGAFVYYFSSRFSKMFLNYEIRECSKQRRKICIVDLPGTAIFHSDPQDIFIIKHLFPNLWANCYITLIHFHITTLCYSM